MLALDINPASFKAADRREDTYNERPMRFDWP